MYVAGISSGSVRNRTIATPSGTSSSSVTPTIRRFDVLLNEQVSLVSTAQDGLRQALERYEKASSKEEQESARLQVQSLLSRAEELVLSLQVVIHIRRELTHTQLYAMDLRKKGKDTTDVLKRLTWLEQRLEKLLFARRRGRPGARGRRTQINRQYLVEHQSQMNSRYPPPTPMDQISTALPSVAADETDDSDSDLCDSSSSPGSNEHCTKQDSRQSYYSTDTSLQIAVDSRTKESSKKQVSLPNTENVNGIDATTNAQGSSVSDDETSPKPVSLPSYILNFERPKSSYDSLSWNALPLAIYSNFLSKPERSPTCSEDLQSENSVMDELIAKIEMFASYIEMAAQAFITPGFCLPVVKKLNPEKKQASSSRVKQSAKIHNELSAKRMATKLPPLELPCLEWSAINWSRRKFNQQNNDNVYPKDYSTWCGPKLSSQSLSAKQKGSAWLPSQLRARSKKSQNSEEHATNEKYFEYTKHRQGLIQDLVQNLKSSVDDVRKDSAQALGSLGGGRMEIMKPLEDLMINDSNYLVQYEAAKSLITLGVWSKSLVDFITCSLANGPSVIQADLLELLATVEDFSQLECADSYCQCVRYTSEIVKRNGINRLSLLAAVVASNMNHQYIHCHSIIISRLQAGLTDDISHNRSKALCSLALKWNIKASYVVEEALEQLYKLFEWTLRLEAIKVLLHVGKVCLLKIGETRVFNLLVDKLSSDPIQVVRHHVGKLITAIGLRIRTLDLLLKQLNDHNDNVRTRAVMAMGNFDLKGTKYMQGLLDLLELDANQNVRIQVLRVFGNLKFYEARVIEKLLERDKGTGVIAKEAQKALKNLEKENVIKGYS